jgi:replicative DNA helicase
MLGVEHFVGYEKEFNFIQNHKDKYGNVPDKATFLAEFPDFDLVEVNESDRYLVDTIREEHLYYRSIPVIQKAAELLKSDSNAAAEYMMQQSAMLQPNYELGGMDIVSQAAVRFEEYKDRKANQDKWYFETGFKELDDIIHGLQRGEELFVLFARVNQGKSWILAKMCSHVWKTGFNVGYVSPEMSASSIGFRFDTLVNNFSNKKLLWGNDDSADAEYEKHINELKNRTNRFMVSTPLDFDKRITVSKLRNWVKQYKLDLLAIDGITYITDERGRAGDNKTTSLTNVSEDLMSLSMELKIPILVVVQANRSGVGVAGEDGTPELESIRDSDGIAHNASKVISIRQKQNGVLEMGIKKQRFGAVGGKLNYTWDIDTGEFTFIPSFDDAQPRERTETQVKETKKKFKDKADVF